MRLRILSREEWGALPPVKTTPLKHPAFIITFVCIQPKSIFDIDTVKLTQRLQRDNQSMDDIQSNFLIGRDGTVFEGRGWHVRPEPLKVEDQFFEEVIEIAFIGSLEGQPKKHPANVAMMKLLKLGLEKKYLNEPFMCYGERKVELNDLNALPGK